MIVQHKIGNLCSFEINNRTIDRLPMEWYETSKRILHKHTQNGRDVVMKFMRESQYLTQDDVIYEDEETIIIIDILPCDVIIIRPKNMFQMASVCYEIGNKHLPLFFEDDEVLVVMEMPLLRLLTGHGYEIEQGKRKLINPLKSSVVPHGENGNGETLFSKIMKLTNPAL